MYLPYDEAYSGRSAFMKLGLRYDIDTSPYLLRFDENLLSQSPSFTSLWQRAFPLEKLSQRRRNATFDWVNKTTRADWKSRE
jgi:hypothetical protein